MATVTAAVTREDDVYVARCLEVEVASQGRTVDEALANLREAVELLFADDDHEALRPVQSIEIVEVKIPA